jgi:hypothetical protein
MHAIREIGMDVKDAFEVILRDQLRKFAGLRQSDLVASLPQLRRDEGQAKLMVDLIFSAAARLAAWFPDSAGAQA